MTRLLLRFVSPFSLLLLLTGTSFSQVKFEKESRVKALMVPAGALRFVSQYASGNRIKWYVEESQLGKTYEAKTKLNGYRFSIEFDSVGQILDLEKTVDFSELDAKVQHMIREELRARFDKYKIIKVQIQYRGKEEKVGDILRSGFMDRDLQIFFELIVRAEMEIDPSSFEVLFNEMGQLEAIFTMLQRSTDNLEF